jgi:hypothetical protein
MDSLDAGAPSTSGRAPDSSSSGSGRLGYNHIQSQLPNGYNLEDSWDLTDDSGYTPFPVNLPAGGGGAEDAAHGMDLNWHGAPALHLSDSKELWGKLGQVCMLLSPCFRFLDHAASLPRPWCRGSSGGNMHRA